MKGFYRIWAWRPSWSCDTDVANKLSFSLPGEAPHKNNYLETSGSENLALIGHVILEKNMFEKCERTTTNGRRRSPDHGYTISSHSEPAAQVS